MNPDIPIVELEYTQITDHFSYHRNRMGQEHPTRPGWVVVTVVSQDLGPVTKHQLTYENPTFGV